MTLPIVDRSLVNWTRYAQSRAELGVNFVRILGYFREDGVKSLRAIEAAIRARNAAGMVIPAHTLKGESRQFGADPLSDLAETIEMRARECVEHHDTPELLVEDVVRLRPLFDQTLALLESEASPPAMRRPAGGFGRRIAST